MTKSKNPKNVAELVSSAWYGKLKTLVFNFHLNEPLEDTMNDILLDLMEKDYLNRWSSENGSYSNWLYTFASNICKKKYNKSHTKGGYAIEGASSLTYTTAGDGDFVQGEYYEEYLDIDTPESLADSDAELNSLKKAITEVLSKYPAHSSNSFDGVVYKRDMLTVFTLTSQDYTPKEIAEVFGTSIEFVYTLIRRMRPLIKNIY